MQCHWSSHDDAHKSHDWRRLSTAAGQYTAANDDDACLHAHAVRWKQRHAIHDDDAHDAGHEWTTTDDDANADARRQSATTDDDAHADAGQWATTNDDAHARDAGWRTANDDDDDDGPSKWADDDATNDDDAAGIKRTATTAANSAVCGRRFKCSQQQK